MNDQKLPILVASQIVFMFTPYLGKMNPFWRAYFSDGLKPPTSFFCYMKVLLQFSSWLIVGLGWWFGILRVPLSNNPFHRGILGIQTTGAPNQQVAFSWSCLFEKNIQPLKMNSLGMIFHFSSMTWNLCAPKKVTVKVQSLQVQGPERWLNCPRCMQRKISWDLLVTWRR